jgi:hypothetical protein
MKVFVSVKIVSVVIPQVVGWDNLVSSDTRNGESTYRNVCALSIKISTPIRMIPMVVNPHAGGACLRSIVFGVRCKGVGCPHQNIGIPSNHLAELLRALLKCYDLRRDDAFVGFKAKGIYVYHLKHVIVKIKEGRFVYLTSKVILITFEVIGQPQQGAIRVKLTKVFFFTWVL